MFPEKLSHCKGNARPSSDVLHPEIKIRSYARTYILTDEWNIQEGHGRKDGGDTGASRVADGRNGRRRRISATRRLDGIVNSGEELLNFSKRRSSSSFAAHPLFLAPISADAASFPSLILLALSLALVL